MTPLENMKPLPALFLAHRWISPMLKQPVPLMCTTTYGKMMENAIGTSKWWFQFMCTIFGMIEVDTFKKFCHFNRHIQVPSHRNFIERLVIMLLTNSKGVVSYPDPCFHSRGCITSPLREKYSILSSPECWGTNQIRGMR